MQIDLRGVEHFTEWFEWFESTMNVLNINMILFVLLNNVLLNINLKTVRLRPLFSVTCIKSNHSESTGNQTLFPISMKVNFKFSVTNFVNLFISQTCLCS